jgi:putative membrane protein
MLSSRGRHVTLTTSFYFTNSSLKDTHVTPLVALLLGQAEGTWRPTNFGQALYSTFAFGVIGLILGLLGYKLFDWMTPRMHVEHELAEKHNLAVAMVISAVIIGSCIVVAAAIVG